MEGVRVSSVDCLVCRVSEYKRIYEMISASTYTRIYQKISTSTWYVSKFYVWIAWYVGYRVAKTHGMP